MSWSRTPSDASHPSIVCLRQTKRVLLRPYPASKKNPPTPNGVGGFFGAGYGSRTRLNGLGSRCNTDIPTLQMGTRESISHHLGKSKGNLAAETKVSAVYHLSSPCILFRRRGVFWCSKRKIYGCIYACSSSVGWGTCSSSSCGGGAVTSVCSLWVGCALN